MTKRPELLIGRIILFTVFIVEHLFWRLAVNRTSNILYGCIFVIITLPIGVRFGIPSIYVAAVLFTLTLTFNPSRYLLLICERRMHFWAQYDYDLAKLEKARCNQLRKRWWRKPKGHTT